MALSNKPVLKKILISGANHSLAYQLAWFFKNQEILFCDNKNHTNIIPSHTSNAFAHQFLNYCLNHQIEMVFPLRAEELSALTESKILFKEFGIELMVPDSRIIIAFQNNEFIESLPIISPLKIDNFVQFSTKILKAGYPQKPVFFGRADLLGNLYEINDDSNAEELIWTNGKRLSFTQASKLINQQPFIPLNIYPEVSEINYVHILFLNNEVLTENNLSESRRVIIQKINEQYKIQGFYELAFADDRLLRIKPVSIC